MIALTLALYITVYLALIVAYVTVIKYMAEKPTRCSHRGARRRRRAGAITPPPLADAAAAQREP